jgi:parvulin-like peptidyl-prolyl isomerase
MQFGSYAVAKYGKEDELIATATTLKKGTMSAPSKGTAGVWIVQVENIKEPEKIKDVKEQQKIYTSGLGQRGQYEPMEALKKVANIEDHKARFDY